MIARVLVVVAVALAVPASAVADQTIDFEGFPAGTVITNQYANKGVVFGPLPGSGGNGFRPVVATPPAGQAHSGSAIGDIHICNVDDCKTQEFFPATTTGTFQSPRKRVSVRVGLGDNPPGGCNDLDQTGCAVVTLQAYNANGDPIGAPSSATVFEGQGFHTLLAVEQPAATIRGFRIGARFGPDNNEPVGIDDLSFDDPNGPPPPDFTLTPAKTFLVMSQGSTLRDRITIGRTTGSSGNIRFTATGSLPRGVRTRFEPNPAGGGATDLVITADPNSGVTGFEPTDLSITGAPLTPTAGSAPRTFLISLQVRTGFTLAVPGPTDFDLAPCVVRVPVRVDRDFGFAGPVSLGVTGLANGVQASFDPPQITFPNGSGSETGALVVTGPATGVAVPPTTLTITASAPPLATRTAKVTVHGTCPAQYDARVTSLEITQGTQTQSLPERFPDPNSGSPITYSEILGAANLRRGAPTVVRVYANLQFGPAGGVPNVPMVLRGFHYDRFDQRNELPDSPLSPVSGLRTLALGPVNPTPAEVGSETNVYTFALPPSWTSSKLAITAALLPSLGGGPLAVAPCDTEACRVNDTMRLTRIPFVGARMATINPLEFSVNGASQPDPTTVFTWAQMAGPLELRIRPYQTTIDITDIANERVSCVNAATTPDEFQGCADAANSGVADRVEDWTCDHPTDDSTWNVGINTGVARGLQRDHFCVLELFMAHDAVVERRRPLTSVAHELGHLFGRPHADKVCGGDGESWPPNDDGALQSVGLATGAGTGFNGGPFAVIAPPKVWFDYMSYCAGGANSTNPPKDDKAWISVRNWNKILGAFDFENLKRKPLRAVVTGPKVPALAVSAFASPTGTQIRSVRPVRAPALPPSTSAYHLVGFNLAGGRVADVAMIEANMHVDGERSSRSLNAVIPAAGVAKVAIVKEGATLATRASSGHLPTVAVRRVPAFRRGLATIRWRARDRDGDRLLATIERSADGGRTFAPIWTGPSRALVRVPARYFPRSSRARVRVTVNDGFGAATATSRRFRAPGAAPVVDIVTPARRVRQPNDAPLVLAAHAFDDRSRPLRGLRWFMDRRALGRGKRISRAGLPPGRHRIGAVARDRAGRTGRASVRVTLTGARPLFLTAVAVKRTARAVRLRVASSLPARLAVRSQRFRVGREPRRLRVRVRRGGKVLKLRLVLTAGGRTSTRTLLVRR